MIYSRISINKNRYCFFGQIPINKTNYCDDIVISGSNVIKIALETIKKKR